MAKIIAILGDEWPVLVAAFSGFIVSFLCYLKSRFNFKAKLCDKEAENLKLQQVIAQGSYVLCPNCGAKVKLYDAEIKTGGLSNEK